MGEGAREACLPGFGMRRAHLGNVTMHFSLAPTLCLKEAWLGVTGPCCSPIDPSSPPRQKEGVGVAGETQITGPTSSFIFLCR